MLNNKNKGISIVEVVIALAVFVILMIPIVTSLVSSMKNTTKSKTLQYRNDYAQDMVEYIKRDSMDNIQTGDYFTKNGSDDFTFSSSNGVATTEDGGTTETAEYETYFIDGSVKLGAKEKKYSYKIKISNEDYAMKELTTGFKNPNNLKMGVVEDLDHTKLALINGTIANYDQVVESAYLAKKIAVLREHATDKYEQYMSTKGTINTFNNDTGTRKTIVKVEKDGTKYKVSCILKYHDNSTVGLDNGKNMSDFLTAAEDIEYIPYTAVFDELPDIYLMYNPCIYNGQFATKDYIIVDTTGLGADPDVPVNLFIVETAEKYSDTVATVLTENGASTSEVDKELYRNNVTTLRKRKDVKVYLAATNTSTLANDLEPLIHVYHNFDDIDDASKKNKKNHLIYHTKSEIADATSGLSIGYKGLTGHPNKNAIVESMSEATQEERGLYKIEVWMREGEKSDININTQDPILTATKGGSES